MNVKFARINENAKLPEFKTSYTVGADLYACNNEHIEPDETKTIHIGINNEFDEDSASLIYARSGLARKYSLAPANKIDFNYKSEWMAALHNHSLLSMEIKINDNYNRLGNAYMDIVDGILDLIAEERKDDLEISEEDLSNTDRGEGGFGFTKIH